MINYNSSYEEIIHHMAQMQMVVLSQKEEQNIKKLMELQAFLNTSQMKKMIEENLKDKKWLQDTKTLIDIAQKKDIKNNLIINHLEECKNFLIYKIIEKKCRTCSLEMTYQNREWIFNEIDHRQEKSRWVNQRFNKHFSQSPAEKMFIEKSEQASTFTIDLNWLHVNRELFFCDNVFENLNFSLQKKNNIKN